METGVRPSILRFRPKLDGVRPSIPRFGSFIRCLLLKASELCDALPHFTLMFYAVRHRRQESTNSPDAALLHAVLILCLRRSL